MKTRRIVGTVLVMLVALIALFLTLSTTSQAGGPTERHVCKTGCEFNTLQGALDASSDGDVIKIATGTYTEVLSDYTPGPGGSGLAMALVSKTVTIRGGYQAGQWNKTSSGPEGTVLDAENKGRIIIVISGSSPTIENLTITGGNGGKGSGGGIYAYLSTPTIRDCRFINNTAGDRTTNSDRYSISGSAVASFLGGVNIYGSEFRGNGRGGLVISSCRGGIIEGNRITNNAGTAIGIEGIGAGVIPSWGAHEACIGSATIERNIISNNTGSGIYLLEGTYRVSNNSITGNRSGVTLGVTIFSYTTAEIRQNTITGNQKGIDNQWTATGVLVVNNIISGNETGMSCKIGKMTTTSTLWWQNGTDTVGNVTVTGPNLHANPMFLADGYHLNRKSPAKDAGVGSVVTVDIDGQTRPLGKGFDIGADEVLERQIPQLPPPNDTAVH